MSNAQLPKSHCYFTKRKEVPHPIYEFVSVYDLGPGQSPQMRLDIRPALGCYYFQFSQARGYLSRCRALPPFDRTELLNQRHVCKRLARYVKVVGRRSGVQPATYNAILYNKIQNGFVYSAPYVTKSALPLSD